MDELLIIVIGYQKITGLFQGSKLIFSGPRPYFSIMVKTMQISKLNHINSNGLIDSFAATNHHLSKPS